MTQQREQEALDAMLRTPSITPMHEYMYTKGVEWADNNPSEELISKILMVVPDLSGDPSTFPAQIKANLQGR